MSLDNFIARPDGNIDWLTSFPDPDQLDFGYTDFIAGIDTTLMGNKTYQQVIGFDGPFPYADKTNYVFTRSSAYRNDEYAKFITDDVAAFVHALKQQPGKDIWLIGGGQINGILLEHDLIDALWLHVIPVMIGQGLPLFDTKSDFEKPFQLKHTNAYSNGIVELKYERADKVSAL